MKMRARTKMRTFTGCMWVIGIFACEMGAIGLPLLGLAFITAAVIMTHVRERVFDVEVRDLDR